METNHNQSWIEKFGTWISNSMTIKLFIIGTIILILMIPQSMISSLISERQYRHLDVEQEVGSKWSHAQLLTGPILAIPYHFYHETIVDNKTQLIKEFSTAYFLPDALDIDGKLDINTLHRGIYDVTVYTGDLGIRANFEAIQLDKLGLGSDQMHWDQAYLFLWVSDQKGIANSPTIQLNGATISAEPFNDPYTHRNGLQIPLSLDGKFSPLTLSAQLTLKGSKEFKVAPIGKTTHLTLSGNWGAPSFQGEFLPTERTIEENSFKSEWTVLHYNRPFGQEFTMNLPDINSHSFGLSLAIPADQYQQSMRSSKYSILVIVLSFLSLFLMEIFTKTKIHPIQYILMGFGLILYYTLLLAISEQFGFLTAYLISSIATTLLILLYSRTIFKGWKNPGILGLILSGFYLFIYVILQLEDLALLIGSIGLFICLAILMFVSQKIKWYADH